MSNFNKSMMRASVLQSMCDLSRADNNNAFLGLSLGEKSGFYQKYSVIKTENGEEVRDCFVLRPRKDKAAVAAIQTYAAETDNRQLARDLLLWLSTIRSE